MLTMTLVLAFIMISASLSFAHIQQQRIQRNQLHLNYLKTRIMAVNKLDLFYIALYESPELLTLATPCNELALDSRQLVVPNEMMQQYRLSERFYLCRYLPTMILSDLLPSSNLLRQQYLGFGNHAIYSELKCELSYIHHSKAAVYLRL